MIAIEAIGYTLLRGGTVKPDTLSTEVTLTGVSGVDGIDVPTARGHVGRADDEDRDVRRRQRDLFEGRVPLAVRQVQIEQDRRDPVPAQPFEPLDQPRRAFDDK